MFLFENIWQTLLGLNGALSRYELTLQLFAGLNLAAFPVGLPVSTHLF